MSSWVKEMTSRCSASGESLRTNSAVKRCRQIMCVCHLERVVTIIYRAVIMQLPCGVPGSPWTRKESFHIRGHSPGRTQNLLWMCQISRSRLQTCQVVRSAQVISQRSRQLSAAVRSEVWTPVLRATRDSLSSHSSQKSDLEHHILIVSTCNRRPRKLGSAETCQCP